jgi:predicted GNAT family N-acyltransferase
LGLGDVLVNAALQKLKDSTEKIYCYAQTSVIPFYEKHSFVEIGNAFMEAGIQHIKMIYKPL